MKKKYAIILGTRPETIKFASILLEMKKRKMNFFIIHTNQHKTNSMSHDFFKEFGLPKVKYLLTGEFEFDIVYDQLKKILKKEQPAFVFVQGDTDTAFISCLCANDIDINVIHRESGLRSYDRRMHEEKNRMIIDRLSSIRFVPTKTALNNLKRENITWNNHVVGQTLVDSIDMVLGMPIELNPPRFTNSILFTFHRKENFTEEIIIKVLKNISRLEKKVLFPCHPNTAKKIFKIDIKKMPKVSNIQVCKSLNYMELIYNILQCKLVITDSGGIQEECAILGTPCVVLRKTTDRPELVKIGASQLIDPETEHWKIRKKWKKWIHPYSSNVAEKICNKLEELDK